MNGKRHNPLRGVRRYFRCLVPGALSLALMSGCARPGGCEGPAIPPQVFSLKRSLQASLQSTGQDPTAFLVVPNPIDATGNRQAMSSSPDVLRVARDFLLPQLASPERLENEFVRIRVSDINEDAADLARPNGQGQFRFELTDVRYSQAMAYYSILAEMAYLEALGFKFVRSRPLFVLVRARSESGRDEANAFYDHNYLNPSSPRLMRLFGGGEFAPGIDAEMYRHELGHFFNESASREVGIDYAGDNGAFYTEGAALHECLADYVAQSYGDKPTIGRWVARNFQGYAPGQPLRSAVEDGGKRLTFQTVGLADGRGQSPERYQVAEWCTRVLWQIRQTFVKEDQKAGAIRSDRLIFSALGMLKRDTSFSQFQQALLSADDKLYCGGNKDSINEAFEARGFQKTPPRLAQQLIVDASPVGLGSNGGADPIQPGASIAFRVTIRNPNRESARNVRVRFEPVDKRLIATTYMQGYGDLPPGATLRIGDNSGLPLGLSVQAEADRSAPRGTQIRYRLRVMSENSADVVFEGALSL